jgi:hypothetical protein
VRDELLAARPLPRRAQATSGRDAAAGSVMPLSHGATPWPTCAPRQRSGDISCACLADLVGLSRCKAALPATSRQIRSCEALFSAEKLSLDRYTPRSSFFTGRCDSLP